MRSPHLVIWTDARACRPIIPDPSRAHSTGPRPAPPRRRTPAPAGLPGRRPRPASCPWPSPPTGGHPGLAAAAVLAGARSIAAIAEWAAEAPQPVRVALGARQQAPGHRSVPAEATIRRTLARLDPDTVAGAIGAWLADRDRHLDGDRGRPAVGRRAVAVDGKTLRGAHPPDGDGRPVHLLAAMDHQRCAVLAQRQVGGAPEEVPVFAPLLARLDLAGVVVTADGLQTHPAAAEFLVTCKQAHYLFTVKANQPRCWAAAPACPGTASRSPTAPATVATAASSTAASKRSRSATSGSRTPPRSSRSPADGASCTPTGGRR
jgi:DDE_Tnp_1-associated